MLVRREAERAVAIGQLSHAWLSGQLARAWGNERFPAPDPREEVILGAGQHDLGWALVDLDPDFNPESGLPRTFMEISVGQHLENWRTAPDRIASQSLHAALVVSMHGRSLSELRTSSSDGPSEDLRDHVEAERRRQRSLREALGISSEEAERTRRQMWTWDGLSLALCLDWRPFTARDVPAHEGLVDVELRDLDDGCATLDPWPLAEERVEVRCEGRVLRTAYPDEQSMRSDFDGARPITLSFTLRREA